MEIADVVVVGAGPAGALTALALGRAGRRVVLTDKAIFPRDKTCGEGLLPSGVDVLERFDLLSAIRATGAASLRGVRYVDGPNGRSTRADFPAKPAGGQTAGLGVRRLGFDQALVEAVVQQSTVSFVGNTAATGLLRNTDNTVSGVMTTDGPIEARVTVAADGLRSTLRSSAGWATHVGAAGRYGLVGHWIADTRDCRDITVRFADGHEWYQAPVGNDEMLISVLGSREAVGRLARTYEHSAKNAVADLRHAERTGPLRAAGRLQVRPTVVARGGLFLVGDAAGYEDPATGEGLALALLLGEKLAEIIDVVLREEMDLPHADHAYAATHRALWRDRRRLTRLALLLSARGRLRGRVLAQAERHPTLLPVLLGINCGYWGFGKLSPRDWMTLLGL